MIRIFGDIETLGTAAADYVAGAGRQAVAARARFDLVLSGGSTPRRTFELLADGTSADRDLWDATHVYWGDERCVPADHPDSNFRMAMISLIVPVGLPPAHVHRIEAEADSPAVVAGRYGADFPACPDLVLLGLGTDGHTASLFPGSPLLGESADRFAVVDGPIEPRRRITMTPRTIASARDVLVLVSGENKRAAMQRVMSEQGDVADTPARLVRDAVWYVTENAVPGGRDQVRG